jgi:hypothetical protein
MYTGTAVHRFARFVAFKKWANLKLLNETVFLSKWYNVFMELFHPDEFI